MSDDLVSRKEVLAALKNVWVETYTGKYWEDGARDILAALEESLAALPAIPLDRADTRTFTMFRRGDLSETHDQNQRPPAPDEPNFWGVVWPDGTCTLRWCGAVAATSVWASFDDAMKVHGHFGDKHDPLLVWDSGALPVLETPPPPEIEDFIADEWREECSKNGHLAIDGVTENFCGWCGERKQIHFINRPGPLSWQGAPVEPVTPKETT